MIWKKKRRLTKIINWTIPTFIRDTKETGKWQRMENIKYIMKR